MSTPTSAALEAIAAQETGEKFLTLVKIEHSGIAAPGALYFNTDVVEFTNSEATWAPTLMQAGFVGSDEGDSQKSARLVLDDADKTILEEIRALQPVSERPKVTIKVVMESEPDTDQFALENARIVESPYDTTRIEAEVMPQELLFLGTPHKVYDPQTAPGWFRGD